MNVYLIRTQHSGDRGNLSAEIHIEADSPKHALERWGRKDAGSCVGYPYTGEGERRTPLITPTIGRTYIVSNVQPGAPNDAGIFMYQAEAYTVVEPFPVAVTL